MTVTSLSPAARARAGLTALYIAGRHRPSADQWAAIDDLLRHLQATADGLVAPAVYVSALPAGTGKSTTLVAFALALCAHSSYENVGMLILCNQVSECHDIAAALQPVRSKLCVIVGAKNEATLALGDHETANEAQIVVATQASLKAALRDPRGNLQAFGDVKRYHYKKKRRAVVAWDEALQFSKPIVLDNFAVFNIVEAVSKQSQDAARKLITWTSEMAAAPEGFYDVPNFKDDMGIDLQRLAEDVADDGERYALVRALAELSDGRGRVVRELKSKMITCVRELPDSLLPITVTDASAAHGVHHASYEMMARAREVVYLKEAGKTYSNLTMRIVPTAASKSVYTAKQGTKAVALINMAVQYIRSVAPKDVLVISYKSSMTMRGIKERTIAAAIDAQLTQEERSRVRHLAWGRHTATNAHKHVEHVLLMGLHFRPRAANVAASGAALDKSMRTDDPADNPTADQVAVMSDGMLRDLVFQGLMRGAARNGLDGDCHPMEAVIPQVKQSGLTEDDYRSMFPGVALVADKVLMPAKPLRGQPKALAGLVEDLLNVGLPVIPYPLLRDRMGIQPPNFTRLLKRQDWKEWLATKGLTQVRLQHGVVGLRA